jgi:hypothetical protein
MKSPSIYFEGLIDLRRKMIFCVVVEVCLNSENKKEFNIVKRANRESKTYSFPLMGLKVIQSSIKAYLRGLKTDN